MLFGYPLVVGNPSEFQFVVVYDVHQGAIDIHVGYQDVADAIQNIPLLLVVLQDFGHPVQHAKQFGFVLMQQGGFFQFAGFLLYRTHQEPGCACHNHEGEDVDHHHENDVAPAVGKLIHGDKIADMGNYAG